MVGGGAIYVEVYINLNLGCWGYIQNVFVWCTVRVYER